MLLLPGKPPRPVVKLSYHVEAAGAIGHSVAVREHHGLHVDDLHHLVPVRRDVEGGEERRPVREVVHDHGARRATYSGTDS